MKKNKQLSKVKLFLELPSSHKVKSDLWLSVPKDFLFESDRKWKLKGELFKFFNNKAAFEFELIEFLEESKRLSFFTDQISSEKWDFHSNLTDSGWRWTFLVEFKDQENYK